MTKNVGGLHDQGAMPEVGKFLNSILNSPFRVDTEWSGVPAVLLMMLVIRVDATNFDNNQYQMISQNCLLLYGLQKFLKNSHC